MISKPPAIYRQFIGVYKHYLGLLRLRCTSFNLKGNVYKLFTHSGLGITIEAQVRNNREELLKILRREYLDFIDVEGAVPKDWPKPPRMIIDGIYVEPDANHELYITDTTFRDGQQAFYAYKVEDSVRLFKLLAELDNGSGRIPVSEFFPYTARDRSIIRALKELNLRYPRVIGWGRARIDDVRLVKELKLDEMVMLMSISDIHIKYKFNVDRARARDKYLEAAEYAMREGINLRCSLEDITRADVLGFAVPLVNDLVKLSERYGVRLVVKLPDTTGVGVPYPFASLPYSIPKLMWVFRNIVNLPPEALEFHGHGDYHMAVANAVSAWLYGASYNNGTMLGIGERAGNVPIEAFVVWYARIKGDFGGMEPRVISRIVEAYRELGYNIPRYQPIVGENAFSTSVGIHIHAQLRNRATYMSMSPEILGFRERIHVGPYSGRSGIAYWLRSMGVISNDGDELVDRVYREVVKMYDEGVRREPIDEEEFRRLIREVQAKGG